MDGYDVGMIFAAFLIFIGTIGDAISKLNAEKCCICGKVIKKGHNRYEKLTNDNAIKHACYQCRGKGRNLV